MSTIYNVSLQVHAGRIDLTTEPRDNELSLRCDGYYPGGSGSAGLAIIRLNLAEIDALILSLQAARRTLKESASP